jgi:NAD dependent epimerase/dehydratase family enzyme
MRVIITGGTGLIGTALTKSLSSDGHEIIILTRNPRQMQGNPTSGK